MLNWHCLYEGYWVAPADGSVELGYGDSIYVVRETPASKEHRPYSWRCESPGGYIFGNGSTFTAACKQCESDYEYRMKIRFDPDASDLEMDYVINR